MTKQIRSNLFLLTTMHTPLTGKTLLKVAQCPNLMGHLLLAFLEDQSWSKNGFWMPIFSPRQLIWSGGSNAQITLNLAITIFKPFTSPFVDSVHKSQCLCVFFVSVCMCHCLHSLGITKPPGSLIATAGILFLKIIIWTLSIPSVICLTCSVQKYALLTRRNLAICSSQENPGEPCSSLRMQCARDNIFLCVW